jgi:GAF domain-containing protein
MANGCAATIEQLQAELQRVCSENAALRQREATLVGDAERRERELSEACEQQAATSEILRVIASSPADMTGALQAIAEAAKRLCSPTAAGIRLVDGNEYFFVAATDPDRWPVPVGLRRPIAAHAPSGEAIRARRTVHTADVTAPETRSRYPDTAFGGQRTTLNVPLVRDGKAVGLITLSRFEVQPYTENEIALIETFADQAVIAIENARLFSELEQRNAELSEALERQTATADVLRVIASSPTHLQDVLDTLSSTAARLCGAEHAVVQVPDGDVLRVVANVFATDEAARHWADQWVQRSAGGRPSPAIMLVPERIAGRAALERRTIYVANLAETQEFPASRYLVESIGVQSQVTAPLIRGDKLIGVFTLHSLRPDAFSPSQIAQLETFADQAVIAIENARLFQELQDRTTELSRALEQQTATAEILRVIASTPTDPQRVLQAIIETAARLCEAPGGLVLQLRERDGRLSSRALVGPTQERARRDRQTFENAPGSPVTRESHSGRAFLEGRTIHLHDLAEAVQAEYPESRMAQTLIGTRSTVAVPMLRHGTAIGVLTLQRFEVKPFTDQQIALLEAFAAQAVIAIENASGSQQRARPAPPP